MKKYNSIKDWPKLEQPREILLNKGSNYISDAGLISILLRTGTKGKDAVSLAREMLKRFGGLRGLLNTDKEELEKIKGLGNAKIAQILAIIEITKRQFKEQITGKEYINNDDDIIKFLSLSMRDLKKEFFKIIFLNNANIIINMMEIENGTVNSIFVYPREIIKFALDYNACNLILVHNHPSGSLEPSIQDIKLTRKIFNACRAVDINVLDHIIVSPLGHICLKDKGLL